MSMRDLIDIVTGRVKEPSLLALLESRFDQRFEAMFERQFAMIETHFPEYMSIARDFFDQKYAWAKTVLKRPDRITWYLRYARILMAKDFADNLGAESPDVPELGDDQAGSTAHDEAWRLYEQYLKTVPDNARFLTSLSETEGLLKHYMDLNIPAINAVQFERQSRKELWEQLEALEEEWRDKLIGKIAYREEPVLLEFPDGMKWVHLQRSGCKDEAAGMGHCGNGAGSSGQTILSLRRIKREGPETFWEPFLTFILNRDGTLGEMKGRGNSKPASRYHSYIVELLKQSLIKGIRGGGYKPENNFDLTDLTEAQRAEIATANPYFLPIPEQFDEVGMHPYLAEQIGWILKNRGGVDGNWVEADGSRIPDKYLATASPVDYRLGRYSFAGFLSTGYAGGTGDDLALGMRIGAYAMAREFLGDIIRGLSDDTLVALHQVQTRWQNSDLPGVIDVGGKVVTFDPRNREHMVRTATGQFGSRVLLDIMKNAVQEYVIEKLRPTLEAQIEAKKNDPITFRLVEGNELHVDVIITGRTAAKLMSAENGETLKNLRYIEARLPVPIPPELEGWDDKPPLDIELIRPVMNAIRPRVVELFSARIHEAFKNLEWDEQHEDDPRA